MQEWINQAEEDYLERDFTYKTPEELRKAVEELKVCKFNIILESEQNNKLDSNLLTSDFRSVEYL